jgi:hypothetical protein
MFAAREFDEIGDGGDGNVRQSTVTGSAGIPGGDEHLRDARTLRDLPRERMFASAGADDEDVQGSLSLPTTPVNAGSAARQ